MHFVFIMNSTYRKWGNPNNLLFKYNFNFHILLQWHITNLSHLSRDSTCKHCVSEIPVYRSISCIGPHLFYAHKIINLCNSFLKPAVVPSLSYPDWISTVFILVQVDLVYTSILDLKEKSSFMEFVFQAKYCFLSFLSWLNFNCIYSLYKSISFVSRPLIYGYKIIDIWN